VLLSAEYCDSNPAAVPIYRLSCYQATVVRGDVIAFGITLTGSEMKPWISDRRDRPLNGKQVYHCFK